MNIANLLKYCPKGTKLYSLIHGEVTLYDVDIETNYSITVVTNKKDYVSFTIKGLYNQKYTNGECILFPSKDQRDWSKFRLPLKRGDIMMDANGECPFIATGEFKTDISPKYICGINSLGNFQLDYTEAGWTSIFYIPTSEEAKKKLFDKMAEAGYKWNADTLELEKIESKFKEGNVIKDNKNNLYLIVDTNVRPKIGCVLNQDMKLTILDKVTTLASIKFTLANEEERNILYSALVREGYQYDKKQHKLTVKDIQEALKNLDESKEFMIVNSYSGSDKIDIEYIKELKENGKEYYKINI